MSSTLVLVIISGIASGSVYALIALSIVIVYKSSEALNFAAGEFVMLGAYIALFFIVSTAIPYWLIMPIVAIVTFAVGAGFERLVVFPIIKRMSAQENPLIPIVTATIGFSLILKGLVRVFPYTEEVRSLPPLISGAPIFIGDIIILRSDIAIVCIAIVFILIFWLFFTRSILGRALQASSQNALCAELCGIPVGRMRMIVWGIAGTMAGICGVLVGPKLGLTVDMGGVIMIALAAAVIGGFSNLPGSIIGGFVIGIAQNLIGYFFGSATIAVAPFLIIMAVLVLRPQGLFGGVAHVKKV